MSTISVPNIEDLPKTIQDFLSGIPQREANYILCHAPQCLIPWTRLMQSIYSNTLPYHYLETGMLRQAYRSGCSYILHHKKQMAHHHGMTDDKIRYLCSAKEVIDLSSEENIICKVADELEQTATISNLTHRQLMDVFEPNEVVEIVIAISFACCVSRFLNAARVEIEKCDSIDDAWLGNNALDMGMISAVA